NNNKPFFFLVKKIIYPFIHDIVPILDLKKKKS
ncbi:hypothetical protein PFAG_03317, partial [Plasmodium falciparum Santa Lucia]